MAMTLFVTLTLITVCASTYLCKMLSVIESSRTCLESSRTCLPRDFVCEPESHRFGLVNCNLPARTCGDSCGESTRAIDPEDMRTLVHVIDGKLRCCQVLCDSPIQAVTCDKNRASCKKSSDCKSTCREVMTQVNINVKCDGVDEPLVVSRELVTCCECSSSCDVWMPIETQRCNNDLNTLVLSRKIRRAKKHKRCTKRNKKQLAVCLSDHPKCGKTVSGENEDSKQSKRFKKKCKKIVKKCVKSSTDNSCPPCKCESNQDP